MHRGSTLHRVRIDEVVARLREVQRSAGWGRITAIAEILIQGVFAGDLDACHSPGRRTNSLRRIANHPDCPYRKTRLSEALAVYVVCEQAPFVRTWEHIAPSHVAAVLPLDQGERIELLRRAESERLSVRSLRELVVTRRRARGERRGRRPRTAGMKALERALSALHEVRRCLACAGPLGAEDRSELLRQLEQIAELLCAAGDCFGQACATPLLRVRPRPPTSTRGTEPAVAPRAGGVPALALPR